tara:strand:- start:5987 stop:7075 length:1089 start_codon:yes stop_codon:yes gene_type:complete
MGKTRLKNYIRKNKKTLIELTKQDINVIERYIADGFISKRKHDDYDLWILNYTNKTQFDGQWSKYTLQCRGLIVDADWNIVARPFKKFFNYGELTNYGVRLPNELFTVSEKMDGSLGILYFANDVPYIATRGSFHSPQADKANEMLHGKYKKSLNKFRKDRTYLFEIVYPENRIVVDYGTSEMLALLAIVDNKSGKLLPLEKLGFPAVAQHNGIDDYDTLAAKETDNAEGFVITFEGGLMMKIKFANYVRLHKLMTGLTEKHIWELAKEGGKLVDILHNVPDEFYDWAIGVESDLQNRWAITYAEAIRIHGEILKYLNGYVPDWKRKDYALEAKNYPEYMTMLFSQLDGNDIKELTWNAIQP